MGEGLRKSNCDHERTKIVTEIVTSILLDRSIIGDSATNFHNGPTFCVVDSETYTLANYEATSHNTTYVFHSHSSCGTIVTRTPSCMKKNDE